ncbi:MAG: hypothetical protein RIC55_00180 [Pirellulaceae bacterium]
MTTGAYDKHGLQFLYPQSWEITEDDAQGMPHVLTLQSPESGFWSLHVYSLEEDPIPLVNQVEQTMTQEYDSLEVERTSQQFGDYTAVGCNMHFYCLDLLVTSWTRAVRTDRATYLFLWQAESREFEVLRPVFEAMTLSLMGVKEAN